MPSLWSSSHTWSCSRCDVDCVISVDLNRLVGLVVRVVREHLQKEKHRFYITEARTQRVNVSALTENTDHSPGSSWSPAESVSTLWQGHEQEWRTDGRVNDGGWSDEEYLHGLVLTVGTQVDHWAVSQQDHDAILSGIILRRSHICTAPTIQVLSSELCQSEPQRA